MGAVALKQYLYSAREQDVGISISAFPLGERPFEHMDLTQEETQALNIMKMHIQSLSAQIQVALQSNSMEAVGGLGSLMQALSSLMSTYGRYIASQNSNVRHIDAQPKNIRALAGELREMIAGSGSSSNPHMRAIAAQLEIIQVPALNVSRVAVTRQSGTDLSSPVTPTVAVVSAAAANASAASLVSTAGNVVSLVASGVQPAVTIQAGTAIPGLPAAAMPSGAANPQIRTNNIVNLRQSEDAQARGAQRGEATAEAHFGEKRFESGDPVFEIKQPVELTTEKIDVKKEKVVEKVQEIKEETKTIPLKKVEKIKEQKKEVKTVSFFQENPGKKKQDIHGQFKNACATCTGGCPGCKRPMAASAAMDEIIAKYSKS